MQVSTQPLVCTVVRRIRHTGIAPCRSLSDQPDPGRSDTYQLYRTRPQAYLDWQEQSSRRAQSLCLYGTLTQ